MTGPRIGALFAGYGGLEMGVQSVLGGDLAWYSEIDKGALKILTHRHPDVPNVGDVTTADWSQVEPVDILTGGSPCQDLSHAGKRAGMTDGTRSNLWVAMREAIARLRPGLIVWENVRGAYSAEADSGLEFCAGCMGDAWYRGAALRALGRVLGDLSDLGYDAGWHGLRAADVGAPHGRMRVFVVAYPSGDAGRFGYGDGSATTHGNSKGCGLVGWQHTVRRDVDGCGGADGPRAETESTSLLPTPATSDTNGPGAHGDGGLDLRTAVSLLPTPRATDGTKGGPNQRGSSGDLMLPSAVALLPTPAVNDMGAAYTPDEWDAWTDRMKTEHGNGNGHGKSLHIEAARLLPTPTDMTKGGGKSRSGEGVRGEGHAPLAGQEAQGPALSGLRGDEAATRSPRGPEPSEQRSGQPHDALRELPSAPALAGGPSCAHGCGSTCSGHSRATWGEYEAAIRRWEVRLGRPAPEPTRLSKKGTPQLAADFCEWMMGLPAGWVTDTPGITRNEALKALGNGVVPQQAEAALRMSADYCRLAEWRTNDRNQLAKVLGVAKTDAPDEHQLDLFGEATA